MSGDVYLSRDVELAGDVGLPVDVELAGKVELPRDVERCLLSDPGKSLGP